MLLHVYWKNRFAEWCYPYCLDEIKLNSITLFCWSFKLRLIKTCTNINHSRRDWTYFMLDAVNANFIGIWCVYFSRYKSNLCWHPIIKVNNIWAYINCLINFILPSFTQSKYLRSRLLSKLSPWKSMTNVKMPQFRYFILVLTSYMFLFVICYSDHALSSNKRCEIYIFVIYKISWLPLRPCFYHIEVIFWWCRNRSFILFHLMKQIKIIVKLLVRSVKYPI